MYPLALVVAYVVQEIRVNVGEQIVSEWNDFYKGSKKSSFISSLVSSLCKRAGVPVDDSKFEVDNDDPFNPLLVRKTPSKVLKKRKVGEAESRWVAVGSDDDDDDEDTPTRS